MSDTSSKLARVLVHSALFGFSLAAILFSSVVIAQTGGGAGKAMLKQKLEAIKASATENQHKLHQYMWTETSTITVNGRAMPPKVSNCFYGPDGKVHKEPIGGTADTGADNNRRRGRLMQHVMAEKKADMTAYMQQVGRVIKLYMPPDPQKMEQAFQGGKVSLDHTSGEADLVFKGYALPGDSMTIGLDTATRKIGSLNVKSYLDTPQNPVTLTVDFARLPDGTNHPSRTVLDAQAKGIHVVNTNSNYRKAGQS